MNPAALDAHITGNWGEDRIPFTPTSDKQQTDYWGYPDDWQTCDTCGFTADLHDDGTCPALFSDRWTTEEGESPCE